MADRQFAGPLGAVAPSILVALLLCSASPAVARPHGSPDLTPTLLLPRAPDFELLSLVSCLSGPCIGTALVAQTDPDEPGDTVAAAPAVETRENAGSGAQGQGQQRPVTTEPAGTGAAGPVIEASTLGAAGQFASSASRTEAELRPAGDVEDNLAQGDELSPAGAVENNVAVAPDLGAGDFVENTDTGEDQRAAGDLLVASLPDAIELRPAGELEDNTGEDLDLRPAGEVEEPTSGLLSLHGRQAALDEAFGVGGLAPGQMLGLRRLSLTAPNMMRVEADSGQAPGRTALRDLGDAPAEIIPASQGPMDSDERDAIRRHGADRRPDPEAPAEEPRAPTVAPAEPSAPVDPAAPTEPLAPVEPRAPGAAPSAPGNSAGGAATPQQPS